MKRSTRKTPPSPRAEARRPGALVPRRPTSSRPPPAPQPPTYNEISVKCRTIELRAAGSTVFLVLMAALLLAAVLLREHAG